MEHPAPARPMRGWRKVATKPGDSLVDQGERPGRVTAEGALDLDEL
jgi:hypothetical protein